MAEFDNRSDQVNRLLFNAAISTDTDTTTASFDNSDFGNGFFLATTVSAYTDGTYVVTLEDSPDDSVWTAIAADKLIGPAAGISLAAATSAANGEISTIGAFSNEKFVRATIASTSTTTGATLQVSVVARGEYPPVAVQ